MKSNRTLLRKKPLDLFFYKQDDPSLSESESCPVIE